MMDKLQHILTVLGIIYVLMIMKDQGFSWFYGGLLLLFLLGSGLRMASAWLRRKGQPQDKK